MRYSPPSFAGIETHRDAKTGGQDVNRMNGMAHSSHLGTTSRSPLPRVIGGPGARAAVATPAALLAAGRPLAVTLLVVGLAGLTAVMLWALERSGSRAARARREAEPWDGVRQAAVSAARDGEQRAAVCEAARGIARADSAQLWELGDGGLVAGEAAGTP